MNPDHQEQARRLNEIRSFAAQASQGGNRAGFSASSGISGEHPADGQPVNDPLMYQGIYAPSGFDMMDILVQVYKRPNPQIEIGNVDSAVALVLCDAEAHDHPIVYCSEPFESLTGYSGAEIIGKNCRFLQNPPGGCCSDRNIIHSNSAAKREVKQNMNRGRESRVRLTNYRKDGTPFTNILTLVPILWQGNNYIVGFQADERSFYR